LPSLGIAEVFLYRQELKLNSDKYAETIAEAPNTKLAREHFDTQQLEDEARALIAAREKIEHDNWADEPEINARTALFEELTAKGHLSRIVFEDEVELSNRRTLKRLLNGWSDNLPQWEKDRRLAEIVEELIVHYTWDDINNGRLSADALVATVSDYPEMAPEHSAHKIGYRALNYKGMVRVHSFEQDENGRWHRVIEQISRSNSTNSSSRKLLADIGRGDFIAPGSQAILSNQAITNRAELPDGVVDLQRILDRLSGENILYGEDITVAEDAHRLPAYGELREVSQEREAQAEIYIKRLADFERALDLRYKKGEITYNQKQSLIYEERTKIVNEICLLDPNYARDARGELSAKYYKKAALAMAAGDDAAGMEAFASAINTADERASVVCGGNGFDEQQNASPEAKAMYNNAKANRKKWGWKDGFCIMTECKPEKVKVGPCSVCRECQQLFDNGWDEKSINWKYRQEKKIKDNPSASEILSAELARIERAIEESALAKQSKQAA
jgi:hypothetical protein